MTAVPPPEVSSYSLRTAEGRRIRTATKVVWPDGFEVRFTELMPARAALAQAEQQRARGQVEAFSVVELRPSLRIVAAAGDLLRADPRLARALERAAREV